MDVDGKRYLLGVLFSTFNLALLIGTGGLTLWFSLWIVIGFVFVIGIAGIAIARKRFPNWMLLGNVFGLIIGLVSAHVFNDVKKAEKIAGKEPVALADLASLPDGESVRFSDIRIPQEYLTTYRVETDDETDIEYEVVPLVPTAWHSKKDEITVWVRLAASYQQTDANGAFEFVMVKDEYSAAVQFACAKHKLQCVRPFFLVRPLSHSADAAQLPGIVGMFAGFWIVVCLVVFLFDRSRR